MDPLLIRINFISGILCHHIHYSSCVVKIFPLFYVFFLTTNRHSAALQFPEILVCFSWMLFWLPVFSIFDESFSFCSITSFSRCSWRQERILSFYHFTLPHKFIFRAIHTGWHRLKNTEVPTILWCNCCNKSHFNKIQFFKISRRPKDCFPPRAYRNYKFLSF